MASKLIALAGLMLLATPPQQLQQAIADPEILERLPAADSPLARALNGKSLRCFPKSFQRLPKPERLTLAGREFDFDGVTLSARAPDNDGVITLGVLGALKDFEPETRRALAGYLKRFQSARVDAVVLAGDIAASEGEMIQLMLTACTGSWPVLALSGNSESRAAFNRAVLAAMKVCPDIVNLNLLPRVELGGATIVALGGYHDRRFIHQRAGCLYGKKQLQRLATLLPEANSAAGPVVFISHGPPRGRGPLALDRAVEGGNVGDPLLASFLAEHSIPFAIFGHILEAGGSSDDGHGKPVPADRWVKHLYLNVGSANPLAWQLNSGQVSCGLAALVEIKDRQARYRLLRRPCR